MGFLLILLPILLSGIKNNKCTVGVIQVFTHTSRFFVNSHSHQLMAKRGLHLSFDNSINRRHFFKRCAAIFIFAELAACARPHSKTSNTELTPKTVTRPHHPFTSFQSTTLKVVQQHLFPDEAVGEKSPSAKDINALPYLAWALTDEKNKADGDPEFITKGIGWLNALAKQIHQQDFIQLNTQQQEKIITQISHSQAGENWLSTLIYYLTEALLLDPIYGGNPNEIGWQWLQHQAGFPRPVLGKTYQDFS